MVISSSPHDVAERLRQDIERISTISTVARSTGIPVATLRRHLLHAPDQISLGELYAIAELLRRDPREYMTPASVAVIEPTRSY